MSDIADRYRRLAAAFADKVRAVPPHRWDAPSPCDGWTALDIVRHLVEVHGMFLGFVGRELGEIPPVEDGPLAGFEAAREVVQAALDDPDRAAGSFDGYFGRTTFAEAVDRFVCFDLVVHRWDLARAIGTDERLDPEEVRRLLDLLPTFGDALHSSGAFGPPIDPPAGADEQTRLLCLLGRRPGGIPLARPGLVRHTGPVDARVVPVRPPSKERHPSIRLVEGVGVRATSTRGRRATPSASSCRRDHTAGWSRSRTVGRAGRVVICRQTPDITTRHAQSTLWVRASRCGR